MIFLEKRFDRFGKADNIRVETYKFFFSFIISNLNNISAPISAASLSMHQDMV